MLFILSYIMYRLYSLGAFTKINNHVKENCRSIDGVAGPEDFQVDPETGMLFISSDHRRKNKGSSNVMGAIFKLDLTDENAVPIRIDTSYPEVFHPHGLSFLREKNGRKWLFVINHRNNTFHTVEIFRIDSGGNLRHQKTIADEKMVSPNDIVAMGPEKFYLTNDGSSRQKLARILDVFFQRESGNVAYFNGKYMKVVIEGLHFPNGINISQDRKLLYVSETIGGNLNIYNRNIETGKLSLKDKLFIGAGLDNINISYNNELWIAVQPNLLALAAHMENPQATSPSKVHKIKVRNTSYTIDEVYSDSGEQHSGASVAVLFNNRLIIGAVADAKILICNP